MALHGGPGGAAGPGRRECFDPAAYRVVLFDQRGAAGACPYAGKPITDLSANTTPTRCATSSACARTSGSIAGCDRRLVGHDARASRTPSSIGRVSRELVLFWRRHDDAAEVELVTRGVGRMLPGAWARFAAGVPDDRDGNLAAPTRGLLA